ncbi:hypothetical protein KW785_00440 [Candidatus Parcubacteria bacterium]|nr:hypothetical protein [Candidatus Parcubacteria bacterium]
MLVRVSIGRLTPMVRVPAGEVDAGAVVGILNPTSYAKGKRLFQPLGGAVELTKEGVDFLAEEFGATQFHVNKEGGTDARFIIDDPQLAGVFDFFREGKDEFFSIDPMEELVQELTGNEFPKNDFFGEIPPALDLEAVSECELEYRGTIIQPFSDKKGSSPLAGKEPSRRMFHVFDLLLPRLETFEDMLKSPALLKLHEDDLATIDGGRKQGKTKNGDAIADNFIFPASRTPIVAL